MREVGFCVAGGRRLVDVEHRCVRVRDGALIAVGEIVVCGLTSGCGRLSRMCCGEKLELCRSSQSFP